MSRVRTPSRVVAGGTVPGGDGSRVRGRRPLSKLIGALLTTVGTVTVVGALGTTAAFAAPTMTVTPSTGLTNGQSVTITGSGYANSSPGNVLECNNAPGQPTVHLGSPVDSDVSVGCTGPSYTKLVSTTSTGTLNSTYSVIAGTVGPPCGPGLIITTCPSTDSAGKSPATDAAAYPCPPTAAQLAAGVTCSLSYGDLANDSASANISFASSGGGATTTTSSPGSTATTQPSTTSSNTSGGSTSNNSSASSSSSSGSSASGSGSGGSGLAFTGPGRGLAWTAGVGAGLIVLGLLLFLFGCTVLFAEDGPRGVLRRLALAGSGSRRLLKSAAHWRPIERLTGRRPT